MMMWWAVFILYIVVSTTCILWHIHAQIADIPYQMKRGYMPQFSMSLLHIFALIIRTLILSRSIHIYIATLSHWLSFRCYILYDEADRHFLHIYILLYFFLHKLTNWHMCNVKILDFAILTWFTLSMSTYLYISHDICKHWTWRERRFMWDMTNVVQQHRNLREDGDTGDT